MQTSLMFHVKAFYFYGCQTFPNSELNIVSLDFVFYAAVSSFRPDKGPGYADAFSNRSVFISSRFQIDPLWTAYSNIYVSMTIFNVSLWPGGENATISLCFQIETDTCDRSLERDGSPHPFYSFRAM